MLQIVFGPRKIEQPIITIAILVGFIHLYFIHLFNTSSLFINTFLSVWTVWGRREVFRSWILVGWVGWCGWSDRTSGFLPVYEALIGDELLLNIAFIYGFIWVYMGLYRFIWVYMDLYGFIWVYMGLYGFIWIYMGLYGFIWVYMGLYGFICTCMFFCWLAVFCQLQPFLLYLLLFSTDPDAHVAAYSQSWVNLEVAARMHVVEQIGVGSAFIFHMFSFLHATASLSTACFRCFFFPAATTLVLA